MLAAAVWCCRRCKEEDGMSAMTMTKTAGEDRDLDHGDAGIVRDEVCSDLAVVKESGQRCCRC